MRKGEGTGRFKLDRSLGEVVAIVFSYLKDSPPSRLHVSKTQNSSHHSHFKYISNTYASQDGPNPESSWPCPPLNQVSSLTLPSICGSLASFLFP